MSPTPPGTGRESTNGTGDSGGMAAGSAHLLAMSKCCCWFDHIKGLKDFYEMLKKIEDNESMNLGVKTCV